MALRPADTIRTVATQPPVRRPFSGLQAALGAVVAAILVFSVGAWGNAFAAFALLPVAVGFCVALFFRWRRGRSAGWLSLLIGNGLVLAFLLSALFLCLESYYRFACDQTDALTSTLVTKAWYDRHYQTSSLGVRDNVNYTNALTAGRRRVTFVG